MAPGIAVTWDNPDIQLFAIGPSGALTGIPSNGLKAATEYEIQAIVHNGSTIAPAIGLPVEFSFLTFGIGTTSTPIGARHGWQPIATVLLMCFAAAVVNFMSRTRRQLGLPTHPGL